MSFPPNLGITNSFIIDSSCTLFQEFPSLLPHLDYICSPFSKHKMNGYSRIKKSNTNRSKSVDFADLSLTRTTTTATTTPNMPKFKPRQTTPDLRRIAVKIATPAHDTIPEHEHEHEHDDDNGVGEVFGAILGQKSTTSSLQNDNDDVVKKSFSLKRSASVTDGYARIHSEQCGTEFGSRSKNVKKKGKLFRAFRRLFRL